MPTTVGVSFSELRVVFSLGVLLGMGVVLAAMDPSERSACVMRLDMVMLRPLMEGRRLRWGVSVAMVVFGLLPRGGLLILMLFGCLGSKYEER